MLNFEMLTADEVSKILRVSSKTVYRLASKGVIPSFKEGRIVRFIPADVEAYIERQREVADGLDRAGPEKQAIPRRMARAR
jgi:putative molybdopterin biosynthesis protein